MMFGGRIKASIFSDIAAEHFLSMPHKHDNTITSANVSLKERNEP
jgi:hypothetical protein